MDETRLKAVKGMYAKKRRQKRWHVHNLRTKEFHKGTLVLVYTLKQHKRKLKLRGLGPFVINSISPSGLARLETLDGEPMANYINGSRLHVYNEPLTLDMLNRMHAAKNKKEAHQKMIKEAQEEAKEQVQKLRNKHKYINKVETSSHLPQPIIKVAVEAMHK